MNEELTFRGIRNNEKVILVVKNHPWTLMPIVYGWLLLAVVVYLVGYFFGVTTVFGWTLAIGLILTILYSVRRYYLWFVSNYVLTNQRIIRVSQSSVFNREISEIEINRIQEMSTEIKGPIKVLLNFGTVRIQTASNTIGRTDLENVADPYDLQQQILRTHRSIVGKSESKD